MYKFSCMDSSSVMFWPFKRVMKDQKVVVVDAAMHPDLFTENVSVSQRAAEEFDTLIAPPTSSENNQYDCTSNESVDSASVDRLPSRIDALIDAPQTILLSAVESNFANEPIVHPYVASSHGVDTAPSSSLSSLSNNNENSHDEEESLQNHEALKEVDVNATTCAQLCLLQPITEMPFQPLEDRDRSMRVIRPPSFSSDPKNQGDEPHIIRLMKLLDRTLSLDSTKIKLDEFLYKSSSTVQRFKRRKINAPLQAEEDRRSVRFIQADRYEIFVQSRNKSTDAFDWLCSEVWKQQCMITDDSNEGNVSYPDPVSIKNAILAYAIQQAEKDERISAFRSSQAVIGDSDGRNVKTLYDNFSLITIYEPVAEQQKHIDLLYPNFQYGLIITDHSPGTNVYRSAQPIRTIQHIRDYVWTDMSDTLCASMDENPAVRSLVELFGDVLCPNIQRIMYDTKNSRDVLTLGIEGETFPTGTLLCLPGSEIHAGPACDRYRTVMFFSACPDITQTIPYHPDTQYFAPLVCCDILSSIWCKICCEDRYYLLCRLVDSIRTSKIQNLERHLFDPCMQRCVRTILKWDDLNSSTYKFHYKRRLEGFTLYDYLWHFATVGRLTSNVGTIAKNVLPVSDIVQPDDLLSIDGLVVEFKGKFYNAQIYKRPKEGDESQFPPPSNIFDVQVYYPCDQSWEGQVDPYTLEMSLPTCGTISTEEFMLFNGTNGVLKDQDGTVILCYPDRHTAKTLKSLKPKPIKLTIPPVERPQRDRQRPPDIYVPSPTL